MNTLNTLITVTFFAPMVLLVVTNLLTARTMGPKVSALKARAASITPQPTHRARAANEQRYLEAA